MKKLIIASLLLLPLTAAAFAQTPEGRTAPPRPGSLEVTVPTGDQQPYSKSVTGKILRITAEDDAFVIDEPKMGQMKFVVNKDTRIRADKKTELGDKPDIKLSDYKPGQMLKVIYRVSDLKVLEVRLKESKK